MAVRQIQRKKVLWTATAEKEALACVWAVEKWRTHLWGKRFMLRTDHQALATLLAAKTSDVQGVARWSV